jgi:hypothetical protein
MEHCSGAIVRAAPWVRPSPDERGLTPYAELGVYNKDGAPHMIPGPRTVLKMRFTGRTRSSCIFWTVMH